MQREYDSKEGCGKGAVECKSVTRCASPVQTGFPTTQSRRVVAAELQGRCLPCPECQVGTAEFVRELNPLPIIKRNDPNAWEKGEENK